jgi:hypothetical protein
MIDGYRFHTKFENGITGPHEKGFRIVKMTHRIPTPRKICAFASLAVSVAPSKDSDGNVGCVRESLTVSVLPHVHTRK